MVGITLKLVNGYPSVANAENKNTQVISLLSWKGVLLLFFCLIEKEQELRG